MPVSWTNYLGVKDMCTVISHNAGGYSFYKNAEHQPHHPLPPERRAARPARPLRLFARRRHGRVLVDLVAAGRQGPVEAQSTSAATACRIRSSPATTTASTPSRRSLFPVEDDVELWDVRMRNTGGKPRKLSVFSYVEFSFHHIEIDNQNLQMSLYASGIELRGRHHRVRLLLRAVDLSLLAASFEPDSYDCLRDSFLGNYRTETNPIAVERGECHGSIRAGRQSLRRAAQARHDRARRRSAADLHARRWPSRRAGKQMQDEVLATSARRRGFCRRCASYWAEEARRVPVQDAARGPGHDDQHLDALPGRDLRGLVAVRVVHRGRRAHWAWAIAIPRRM